MRIYGDFEFTGLHPETDFISGGFIDEQGRKFYAEVTPTPSAKYAHDQKWLDEHVIPFLLFQRGAPIYQVRGQATYVSGTIEEIAAALTQWLRPYGTVHFWSDCLTYDWIVLAHRLFDGVLPPNVYYLPFDIFPLFDAVGVDPDVTREEFAGMTGGAKHNALWDAEVIRACHNILIKLHESAGLKSFL